MKFIISGLLTLQMLHTNLVNLKIGSVVFEKNMLTNGKRRTSNDDGPQPIAIGHLIYSDDLIKLITFYTRLKLAATNSSQ